MTQRSHVPKFGNWDGDDNVPYTAYFEKARKGRNGKMINPNDPEENPDLVSDGSDPGQAPRSGGRPVSEEQTGRNAAKTAHERQRSREDGDLKQFADSPARNENMNRRGGTESTPQRFAGRGVGYGEAQKRTGRQGAPSIGSDNSMDQSPLHPKARVSGRGTGGAPSPSWEGGKGSYESSHGTPGRSRLKPKGDESPDKGAAVPKFGEWDENNPSSADGYTHIFNKVREERQIGAGKVPGMSSESSYPGTRRHSPGQSSKMCCFPWCRK